MLIFDFFSGTGSSTLAFEEAGDTVIRIELDPQFEATHTMDILDVSSQWLLSKYGRPDFIWASPPCTAFSVASMGHHWARGGVNPEPKTEAAKFNQSLVEHTRKLIQGLQPHYGYLIENPRGMLRKLPALRGLPQRTITYCQYGDDRMKPTDLWGYVPGWTPRPMCKNGDPCHTAAPRGSRTGTQGLAGAVERSRVAPELSREIRAAIIKTQSTNVQTNK